MPNTQTIPEQKAALRVEARAALGAISPADRLDAAGRLCERVVAHRVWREAGSVLLFSPLPTEPDIRPLLEAALAARKVLTLPRFVEATRCYEAARICELDR